MIHWGKRLVCVLMTALLAVFLFSNPVLARSGCCSWHGGVCGCDTTVGRQVCCDGTYSPSCTCAYIPKPTNTPIPTPTKRPTPTPTPKPKPSPTPTSTPVPTLSPTSTLTQSPSPIPTSEVLGKETGESTGGSGWLALLLLPVVVAGYLLIKRRKGS